MDLGWLSLAALLIVILVSCTSTINPGLLSIAFAWIIAVYLSPALAKPLLPPEIAGLAGGGLLIARPPVYALNLRDVVAGFPTDLFLTLVAVTLLFTQAGINGTLDQVARVAVSGCRGNVGLMPVMFCLLAFVFAAIGAGNIAATALMAPLAMAVAGRASIPAFLMTIMVVHGALAGALSPISPTGLIADTQMRRAGMPGHEWSLFWHNFAANVGVAAGGYLLLGGWRLFGRTYVAGSPAPPQGSDAPVADAPADAGDESVPLEKAATFERRHAITLGVILLMVVGVIFFGVNIGMAAFAAVIVLTLLGVADDGEAIRKIPWGVIIMVCGVTVLTSLLEKTGGAARFSSIVAGLSNETTAPGVVALLTGLVSVYSSTSGVVLPAFLPMVPRLVRDLGGDESLSVALASSMVVGGHLVDSSPLSTLGALCIASAPATEDRRVLFNKVLAWGLTMAVVGAVLCLVVFGWLR